MNRLLLCIALLSVSLTGTLAQNKGSVDYQDLYSPKIATVSPENDGPLERFHGKLMFTESNRYLSSGDVSNSFWKKYYGAQSLQTWGRYMWSLGLSYVASDLVFNLIYDQAGNLIKDPSFIVGGALALIGGAMDFGGWVKLGNLAKTYNSDPSVRREYSLNLGPTRSGGFGLTMDF